MGYGWGERKAAKEVSNVPVLQSAIFEFEILIVLKYPFHQALKFDNTGFLPNKGHL